MVRDWAESAAGHQNPMDINSLTTRIDDAVRDVRFDDVFGNRLDASAMRLLYAQKREFPLPAPDGIRVREPELQRLASMLDVGIGSHKSPVSGSVGNGLYLLKGSVASPRLPSVQDYAKVLVLAAARIGSRRVGELLTGWLQGERIRVRSSAALKGIGTDEPLEPVSGLRLETLPPDPRDFPRSLHLDEYGIPRDRFVRRTVLSIEYECETPCPLYDPEVLRETFPATPPHRVLVNPNLATVSPESFCCAMSLKANSFVDWFMKWDDYGDVEAFFLDAHSAPSLRRDTRAQATAIVSEDDVSSGLKLHAQLHEHPALEVAIARWRRSKRSPALHEQLVELRIALESVLLRDDNGRDGEKRHRMAIRGAWLLGDTLDERDAFFRTLRDVYDYASSVIHAGSPKEKNPDKLARTVSAGQDLCRIAILRMADARRMPNWTAAILGGQP